MKPLKDWRGMWTCLYDPEQVVTCPDCNGSGERCVPHFSGDPQCERYVVCLTCGGEGDIVLEEPPHAEVPYHPEPSVDGRR